MTPPQTRLFDIDRERLSSHPTIYTSHVYKRGGLGYLCESKLEYLHDSAANSWGLRIPGKKLYYFEYDYSSDKDVISSKDTLREYHGRTKKGIWYQVHN